VSCNPQRAQQTAELLAEAVGARDRIVQPLRQADEAFQTEAASERDRLLGFYEAGLYAFAGVRERLASHYVASLLKTGTTRIIVRLSRNSRRRRQ
jgi:hypothetical protein